VSTQNPCEGLLDKTYGQVLADETLKKQLLKCLHTTVFEVGGLRLFYGESNESNEMFIAFTEYFFANQSDLLWLEKPSDTRIKKFYEALLRLQRDFKNDFMVSCDTKPSSINLSLRLRLALRKFQKEENKRLDSVPIKDMIEYLKWLWEELLIRLRNHGFNIE
jgi:hypothetical protein